MSAGCRGLATSDYNTWLGFSTTTVSTGVQHFRLEITLSGGQAWQNAMVQLCSLGSDDVYITNVRLYEKRVNIVTGDFTDHIAWAQTNQNMITLTPAGNPHACVTAATSLGQKRYVVEFEYWADGGGTTSFSFGLVPSHYLHWVEWYPFTPGTSVQRARVEIDLAGASPADLADVNLQFTAYGTSVVYVSNVRFYEANVDPNPFRFCGEYYDRETNTIYLRARFYNPKLGRFTTEDPYKGSK